MLCQLSLLLLCECHMLQKLPSFSSCGMPGPDVQAETFPVAGRARLLPQAEGSGTSGSSVQAETFPVAGRARLLPQAEGSVLLDHQDTTLLFQELLVLSSLMFRMAWRPLLPHHPQQAGPMHWISILACTRGNLKLIATKLCRGIELNVTLISDVSCEKNFFGIL